MPLSRASIALVVLCLTFTVEIYFLCTLNEPGRWLGLLALGNLGLVLALLALRSLNSINRSYAATGSYLPLAPPSFKDGAANLLLLSPLLFLVFALSYSQIGSPLDWDELDTATRLISPELCPIEPNHPYKNLDLLNPFTNTRNHSVANIGALLTFRLFGVSEQTARYFSIGVLAVLLLLLGIVLPQRLTTPVAALILVHLLFNGLFQWYSHSMRGYISMMAMTSALVAFVIAEYPPQRPKLSLALFTATAIIACLTHSFACFFVLLFTAAYLFWIAFHANRFSKDGLELHVRRALALILISPLPIALCLSQYWFLKRIGYVHTAKMVANWTTVTEVFGILDPFWMWALLTITLISLATRLRRWKELEFLTLFLGLALIVLLTLVVALRSTLFESRFLLAFLIPALIWFYQGAVTLKGIPRAVMLALLTAVLTLGPYRAQERILSERTELMGDFSNFMRDISLWTKSVSAHCLTFSGESDQIQFARGLYYKAIGSPPRSCPTRYHVHFGRDWRGTIPRPEWISARYRPVYSDSHQRELFRERGQQLPLAMEVLSGSTP